MPSEIKDGSGIAVKVVYHVVLTARKVDGPALRAVKRKLTDSGLKKKGRKKGAGEQPLRAWAYGSESEFLSESVSA